MQMEPEDTQGLTISLARRLQGPAVAVHHCFTPPTPMVHTTPTCTEDHQGLPQLPSGEGTQWAPALTNAPETCSKTCKHPKSNDFCLWLLERWLFQGTKLLGPTGSAQTQSPGELKGYPRKEVLEGGLFWLFKPPVINQTFSKAWPCDTATGETPRLGLSKTQTVLAAL